MAKKTAQSNAEGATEISGKSLISDGNLDQVRDILFGAQLKEYDKRFNDLEEMITTELEQAQKDFKSRLEILEEFVKGELSSVNSKIKKEQTERQQDTERLTERQDDHKRGSQNKISSLEETLDETARDLRKMILDQAKNLTDAAEKNYETLKNSLASKAAQLHNSKTDRAALAQMFSEIAVRLGDDHEEDAG
ncbi:MAG: hypothetical protein QNK37_22520 [Acidobacteriota bacterium]|nr:hypothetical protein [Acidobacteriota bacterium]